MFNKKWVKKMRELKSNIKHRPPNIQKDSAGLASLIGFLNDNRVTGAVVPKGEQPQQQFTGVEVTRPAPVAAALEPTPKQVSTQQPIAAPQTPAPVAPQNLGKVFYTGRLKSGKDYVAARTGAMIFSIAEPLYFLQEHFFNSRDKDAPGAREFLQRVGQWGRGLVNADYPLTPERACFIRLIRSLSDEFPENLMVSWKLFGADPDIWMNSMLLRVEALFDRFPQASAAVVNVRFENEYKRLTAEGWSHYHVMASAQTWAARLKQSELTVESPAVKDTSEQLAASLDQSVTKQLSAQRQGAKLRCIWSDDKVACPSPRLLTVSEFVVFFPKQ